MPTAIVSLGSNLGDRAATLDSAVAAIAATAEIRVVRRSSWYETSPVGGPTFQDPFLNGAAIVETTLAAERLLDVLQRIENEHGREREQHWGPRTLDLDLLAYDDLIQATPRLVVPHPRLSFRKFVLQGVVEIAPTMRHPTLARTYSELLQHLNGAPNYVAFVGMSAGFRSQLAAEAADCGSAKLVEATPSDVPAFAELLAAPSLRVDDAIKFLRGRIAAIHESLAEANAKWIVDDGWLAAEVEELVAKLAGPARAELQAEWQTLRADDDTQPKLLAALRTQDELPFAVITAFRKTSPNTELLPTVDLDTSDRERALMEFTAALDAAR